MSKLPVWARKPNHKKTVVATDRGWVVDETGEVLRLVSDLPAKLKELLLEAKEIETVLDQSPEPVADPVQIVEPSQTVSNTDEKTDEQADDSEEKTEESEAETEQKEEKPKSPGRPKKSTTGKKSYYQRKKEREQQKKDAE